MPNPIPGEDRCAVTKAGRVAGNVVPCVVLSWLCVVNCSVPV